MESDMAFLKKCNIVDGRIQYRRRKTIKLYDIKIVPILRTILQYYISLNKESQYVFLIIKRDNAFHMGKDIQWQGNAITQN